MLNIPIPTNPFFASTVICVGRIVPRDGGLLILKIRKGY